MTDFKVGNRLINHIDDPHRWTRVNDPNDLILHEGCPLEILKNHPIYISEEELLRKYEPGSLSIEIGVRDGKIEIEIYGKILD